MCIATGPESQFGFWVCICPDKPIVIRSCTFEQPLPVDTSSSQTRQGRKVSLVWTPSSLIDQMWTDNRTAGLPSFSPVS